jgi:hypothetical protein
MLTGAYSPRRLWEIATQEWGLRTVKRKRIGGKPIALSCLYRILTNPFYAGILEREGKTYPGKHPPIVTLDEFDRVQELLGRPHRPRAKTRSFAFTGLIRCGECGFAVTAEEKTNRWGSRYTYYHCSRRRLDYRCHQPYVQVADLERQLVHFLEEITIPDKFHRWGLGKLQTVAEKNRKAEGAQRQSLENAGASLEKELANLTKLRIRDLLSDEEFLAQRQQLERDQVRAAQAIETLAKQGSRFEPERMLISFSKTAASRFTAADLQAKRLILTITGSNPLLKDQNLNIDAQKPFRRWSKTANYSDMRAFMKDVRTLSQSAELATIIAGIQQLDSLTAKQSGTIAA